MSDAGNDSASAAGSPAGAPDGVSGGPPALPPDRGAELRARASDYLFGGATDADRAVFERELGQEDGAAARALFEAEELAGGLALTVPPVAPRAELRERLLARVRAERGATPTATPAAASSALPAGAPAASPPNTPPSAGPNAVPAAGRSNAVRSAQPWKQWAGGGGEVFLGHDQGAFEATAFPGIVARKLHVDPDAGRSTMLVRMAPGTRFPGHRHGGYEECYVLSGDLHHGSRVMRGGDFEWVDTGSRHGEQWTEEGCLLLIHSSHADVLD